jgi:hypothetical protein
VSGVSCSVPEFWEEGSKVMPAGSCLPTQPQLGGPTQRIARAVLNE